MKAKNKDSGIGLFGIIIGVFVVITSIVVMAMLSGGGDDDRAGEELTWVG